MSECFLENWEVWQIVGFLERFGIGAENAKKIYDLLGINAIEQIEANPYILIDMARGVDFKQIDQMALPPCHAFVQFYVSGDGKKLSCQLYQRSADLFLGVPFNIASYATLLLMLCHTCGYEPGDFVHTFGDVHIYKDHIEQINTQLQRTPRPLPKLVIKRKVESVVDFRYEDFEIVGYDPYPTIKGKVSV